MNLHLSTFLLLITLLIVSNCKNEPQKSQSHLPKETKTDTIVAHEHLNTRTHAYVPNYDTLKWSDLHDINPLIQIDMKYATTDNFVEEQMYECGRCLLRPKVAEAVNAAHQFLQTKGYGLKMLDCYRPRPIQQKLWDKVPNPSYVTPPKKGSMHNRGLAVDLTLVDENGTELDMGTPFDFFGKKAHQNYTNLPQQIIDRRKLLRETMIQFGFKPIRTEWWHYSYSKHFDELSDYLWKCS